MKQLKLSLFLLSSILLMQCTTADIPNKLLVNHVGYSVSDVKQVIFQSSINFVPDSFQVVTPKGIIVYKGSFDKGGVIDAWHTGKTFVGDFSELKQVGTYLIQSTIGEAYFKSQIFKIYDSNIASLCVPLILDGYTSIHPVKKYEESDSKISFYGERNDIVDVHGGWYDASGDMSKYLSHLSYANFMNPQQTPMVVWNMTESAKRIKDTTLVTRILNEVAYGSDFLVRMQDTAGYFYITVFDNWSKDPKSREVCAFQTIKGNRTADYQAAFREGGGMAIAALARMSQEKVHGEYTATQYLEKAKKGFAHLQVNNLKYCDNGKENIIDVYCAFMAATELYNATHDASYLMYARMRMNELVGHLNNGCWFSDKTGTRPFFHGVDAGLPLVSLCRYLDVETDVAFKNIAIQAIQTSVAHEIKITSAVYNSFGYPRQLVKDATSKKFYESFFIPHKNESGYWWQGENARLGSLASAMYLSMPYLTEAQKPLAKQYADNQINWILGFNPYDMCMLDGVGYNNPQYLEPWNWNYKGGICNGMTAGFNNEHDIAYMPYPQNKDDGHRWRWAEQWIPHSAWFMLAVSCK